MAADVANEPSDPSADYEQAHVHSVYDQIAPHFSSTRYKPWPLVSSFLLSLPPGSIGLDVGCGNGKYLSVNPALHIIASDRSPALVAIAAGNKNEKEIEKAHGPRDVLVADALVLPHPRHRFDFAISVAVVHHLSTRARRVQAIKAILETLRRPSAPVTSSPVQSSDDGGCGVRGVSGAGKALIYVWALEQRDSRRGWDEGGQQDVMVPWVMKGRKEKSKEESERRDTSEPSATQDRTFHRYYHLYRAGELQEDVEDAGGRVLDSGYEKDNWWAVASPSLHTEPG